MKDSLFEERFKAASELIGEWSDYYVYINGFFLKGSQASFSAWDHGLLYGDGVFEGIRAYQGKMFRLDEHLERLYNSAHSIGISEVPLSPEEMRQAIVQSLRLNQLKDAHIKPVITRGIGIMGLDPRKASHPSVLIYSYSYSSILGVEPVHLITSSVRRKSPYSVDPSIKSLCYVDNILAKLQANSAGADDALMLDPDGFVAEATAANIFSYQDGKLYTPCTTACLPGITRAAIIELARTDGMETMERNMTVADFYVAEEVFLTGTAAEVVPVASIDGRNVRNEAPGGITRKLTRSFWQLVERESVPYL